MAAGRRPAHRARQEAARDLGRLGRVRRCPRREVTLGPRRDRRVQHPHRTTRSRRPRPRPCSTHVVRSIVDDPEAVAVEAGARQGPRPPRGEGRPRRSRSRHRPSWPHGAEHPHRRACRCHPRRRRGRRRLRRLTRCPIARPSCSRSAGPAAPTACVATSTSISLTDRTERLAVGAASAATVRRWLTVGRRAAAPAHAGWCTSRAFADRTAAEALAGQPLSAEPLPDDRRRPVGARPHRRRGGRHRPVPSIGRVHRRCSPTRRTTSSSSTPAAWCRSCSWCRDDRRA